MTDKLVITSSKIFEIFEKHSEEILKNVFTGYDNPFKKVLEEEQFVNELQKITKQIFSEIVKDGQFQEQLKNKLLEKAVENMMKNR